MPLKIRLLGDPCLREKCRSVGEVTSGERMLVHAMIETMHENKGVGLAAPQVGILKQIFVVDIGDGPAVFINPEIVKTSGAEVQEEGCLSIPDIHIKVNRPTNIVIRYKDIKNTDREDAFSGLMARVIQHENDHLNGTLILDYASPEEKAQIKDKPGRALP